MKWKKNSWQNWPRSPKRQSRSQRPTTTQVVLLVAGADLVVLTLLAVNHYRQNVHVQPVCCTWINVRCGNSRLINQKELPYGRETLNTRRDRYGG